MRPPFFVVGAPRSGTTYLQTTLDRHPEIFCTNENRIMTAVARALTPLGSRTHGDEVRAHLEGHLRDAALDLYREIGADLDRQRWGDKHPHYADPSSPSALGAIDGLFPGSQLVWLRRDRDAVANSIDTKGWREGEKAYRVWDRIEQHRLEVAESWGDRLLTVEYDDLPKDAIPRILEFLRVAPARKLVKRARREWLSVPYAHPVSW